MNRRLALSTLCALGLATSSLAGCGDDDNPMMPVDSGPGRVDAGAVDSGGMMMVDAGPGGTDSGPGPGVDAGPDFDAGSPMARTLQTQGSAIVLSPDDRIAVAANRTANTISIVRLDFTAASPITSSTSIDVPNAEPWMAVMGNDGNTAYVVLRRDQQVVKVQGLGVVPTLDATRAPTGSEPTGIAISPTGRRLYVANWAEGTVTVIDSGTMAVTGTVDLNAALASSGVLGTVTARSGLAHPRALVVTNDGDGDDDDEQLYVTEYFSQRRAGGIPAGDAQFDESNDGIVYQVATGTLAVAPLIHIAPVSDTGFVDSRGAPMGVTGCFPNQLQTAALSGGRLYVGALCESPRGPTGPVIDTMTGLASNTANFKTQIHTAIFAIDTATNLEVSAQRVLLPQRFQARYDAAAPAVPDDATRRIPLIATDLAFVPASNVAYLTSYGSDAVFRVRYNADGTLNEVGSPLAHFINLASTAAGAPAPGRLPIGLAIASSSMNAIALNENTRNVSAIALSTQSVVSALDVTALPAAGSPAAAVNAGRRFFVTGLGRWSFRGQGWNSCETCHGDGLTDNVTWYFARGPRQSTSLDGTFSVDGTQQRVLNWSAIFDEVHDFELNTRGNSGGLGAIVHTVSMPTAGSDRIHFDGSSPVPAGTMATPTPQAGMNGSTRSLMPGCPTPPVSALYDWNLIESYVKTIRSPRAPVAFAATAADVVAGRTLFEMNNCASCHGTNMWTTSRVFWTPNQVNNAAAGLLRTTMYTAPAMFPAALNPPTMAAGRTATLRFPAGMTAAANDQIQCILRAVGTFGTMPTGGGTVVNEVRADMTTAAQGASGYNPPSLFGVGTGAPYYHAGNARTLEEAFGPAFDAHHTSLSVNFLITGDRATQTRQIVAFLMSIDESTPAVTPPTLAFATELCPATL